MAGKAVIFLVVGFSLIFLAIGKNFGGLSTRAVDNLADYYTETVAHDIAVTGANMAANRIFRDPTWTAGYDKISYQNGKMNVEVDITDAFKNIRQIVSTGSFNGLTNTVTVTLQPSKFSKFAYYSIYEGSSIWWISSDTVWGPFHTQDYLRVSGNPVFGVKPLRKGMLLKIRAPVNQNFMADLKKESTSRFPQMD